MTESLDDIFHALNVQRDIVAAAEKEIVALRAKIADLKAEFHCGDRVIDAKQREWVITGVVTRPFFIGSDRFQFTYYGKRVKKDRTIGAAEHELYDAPLVALSHGLDCASSA